MTIESEIQDVIDELAECKFREGQLREKLSHMVRMLGVVRGTLHQESIPAGPVPDPPSLKTTPVAVSRPESKGIRPYTIVRGTRYAEIVHYLRSAGPSDIKAIVAAHPEWAGGVASVVSAMKSRGILERDALRRYQLRPEGFICEDKEVNVHEIRPSRAV